MQDVTLIGIDLGSIRSTSMAKMPVAKRCFARSAPASSSLISSPRFIPVLLSWKPVPAPIIWHVT